MMTNGKREFTPGGGQRPGQGKKKKEVPPKVVEAAKNGVVNAVRVAIDKKFIESVEKFGEYFSASNSQVRNIFTAVKRMEIKFMAANEFDGQAFWMLRPRLFYAAQRPSGEDLKPLREVLSPAIDAVIEEQDPTQRAERFSRFCRCCEAIVAYMPRKKDKEGGGDDE